MFGLEFDYGSLTVGLRLGGDRPSFGLKLCLYSEFQFPVCLGTGLQVCVVVVGGGCVNLI